MTMVAAGTLKKTTATGTIIDLGTIEHEEMDFQTGLVEVSAPLLDSSNNFGSNLKGKKRIFTLTGKMVGTQGQIETALSGVLDWVDSSVSLNGTTRQGYYYPLVGPGNATPGTDPRTQTAYYAVLPESFRYEYNTTSTGVSTISYTLVLINSIRVF